MSIFKRLFGKSDPHPTGGPEAVSRALDLHAKGKCREALVYADVCVPHAGTLGLLWRLKGECHFNLNELEASLDCFEKAHTLGGPSSEDLLLWKSMAQANLGRWNDAKATVRRLLRELPSDGMVQAETARNILARYEADAPSS